MPTTMSIEETVRKIVLKVIKKPETEFSTSASFKDMKADSLDVVQIIVAIEDTYGINIKDEDLKLCSNIGEFIGLIKTTIESSNA